MKISQAHFNLLLGMFAQDLKQDECALAHTPKDDEDYSPLAKTYEARGKVWEEMSALLNQARQERCDITFDLATEKIG